LLSRCAERPPNFKRFISFAVMIALLLVLGALVALVSWDIAARDQAD
jgi:hypothetical protein